MKLHHIGLAVERLYDAVTFYEEALGYRLCLGPVTDHLQQARVALIETDPDSVPLELVQPLDRRSPAMRMVDRNIVAYHVCYETPYGTNLEETLAQLRMAGCACLGPAVPAILFDGRRIAWLYTPHHQLVELLEAADV